MIAYTEVLPVMSRIAGGTIPSQCWRCDADDGGENSQRKSHGLTPTHLCGKPQYPYFISSTLR